MGCDGAGIYLDHAASTPIDPAVIEAVCGAMEVHYANPSSGGHAYGRAARDAVEAARAQVAGVLGASAREVIFTAGATESCNLAIQGVLRARANRGRHLVCAATEHKAVLAVCRAMEAAGWSLTVLAPGSDGVIGVEAVREALRPDTVMVCVMAVNNVTGICNPVAGIGDMCRRRGVLFMCDATQAVGKIPLSVSDGIDLLAFSGHKLHGPKGVGALYVSGHAPRVELEPVLHGGGQERGWRSGTVNVPGAVGLGVACDLAAAELAEGTQELAAKRDVLVSRLKAIVPGMRVLGACAPCAPHIASVMFPGSDARELLDATPGIAAAAGAACGAHGTDPDYVYLAMGLTPEEAGRVVRFSVGRTTTVEEVTRAVDLLAASLEQGGTSQGGTSCCCADGCCG
jgi:cysteine desulfurase